MAKLVNFRLTEPELLRFEEIKAEMNVNTYVEAFRRLIREYGNTSEEVSQGKTVQEINPVFPVPEVPKKPRIVWFEDSTWKTMLSWQIEGPLWDYDSGEEYLIAKEPVKPFRKQTVKSGDEGYEALLAKVKK